MATSLRTVLTVGLSTILPFTAASARAQPEPESQTGEYSPYERDAIENAERTLGSKVDDEPEGKIIERFVVVTLDPVESRDPAPAVLNGLHTTTRRKVIERELLVRVGQAYRGVLVDESARRLRLRPQLSVVLCVPFIGTTKDEVWLVVITKDVWSLFPDFDAQIENGGYNDFLLEPKETNFLGWHETLLARVDLKPRSYSLGGAFQEPRLDGSFISVLLDGNVIFARDTGSSEGSYGTLQVIRPLSSSTDSWSWFADVAWRAETKRLYSDGREKYLDDAHTIANEYKSRRALIEGAVTRSFGWAHKNDFTLLVAMAKNEYWAAPAQRAQPTFRMPRPDTRVGPTVEWHAYTSDFLRTLDYDTLGLQEDYRLGYELVARAYPVVAALGSTCSVVGVDAAAQYTVPLDSGLIRFSTESVTEMVFESGRPCGSRGEISDGSLEVNLAIVSPRTPAGRLLFGAHAINRYRNYLNATSSLGSESVLRGYPSAAFIGDNAVTASVEFRTRPVEILAMQWGAAVFYDVGDAFGRASSDAAFVMRSDAGVGLRMAWPEIERAVFRLDIARPFNRQPPRDDPTKGDFAPLQISFSFGQAFGTEGISGIAPAEGNAALE